MTGKTGYTGVTNSDPFTPPADITAVYEHFDPLVGESVATASGLPAAASWPNRMVMALDTKWVYVSDGVNWKVVVTPWIAYTPTWVASGGGTVVSGGTLTGKWQRVGNVVQFRIFFAFGSGTNNGSGDYSFGLPVAAASGTDACWPVPVHVELAGTGYFGAMGVILGGASAVTLISMSSSNLLMGNTVPSWAGASKIRMAGQYEVA